MSRTALIVGGAGQIGRAVAETLLQEGWSVRLAGRTPRAEATPPGATWVQLDREDDAALAAAVGGGVDAVIDCVAFSAAHGRQWLALQDDIGALVVVSSASVYVDGRGRSLDEAATTGFPDFGGPIGEARATVAPGPETYSTNKVALERTLLDEARTPVTVLRPCAIHGPGSTHAREWWFVKRALDGRRRVPVLLEGLSRFHTTATANLAEVCRLALATPGTRVLNVGDPEPPSVRDIGEAIGAAMGHAWEIVGVPASKATRAAATPWSIPFDLLVDVAAAERLGYRPVTTYAEAMPALCAALAEAAPGRRWEEAFPALASYPWNLFDYAAEDALLAELDAA